MVATNLHMSVCEQDSNIIPTAIPLFSRSSNPIRISNVDIIINGEKSSVSRTTFDIGRFEIFEQTVSINICSIELKGDGKRTKI